MNKILIAIAALLIISSTFTSCSKETVLTVEEQFLVDETIILEYIKANNLVTEKTTDGLYYIIENPGSGPKPTITNTVTVKYSGYFTDGVIFDSSDSGVLPLFNTIIGWQKGIPKFSKGGKGKLLVPSKFAYGTSTRPGRANAVLIFDIELLDFN